MVAGGPGGGVAWESGTSRCKLLYIGWTHNKVLRYSTGNYSQNPVINHNGKEYERECICMYVCVYIYIHIYIYMYVCIYIYVYV